MGVLVVHQVARINGDNERFFPWTLGRIWSLDVSIIKIAGLYSILKSMVSDQPLVYVSKMTLSHLTWKKFICIKLTSSHGACFTQKYISSYVDFVQCETQLLLINPPIYIILCFVPSWMEFLVNATWVWHWLIEHSLIFKCYIWFVEATGRDLPFSAPF